MTEAQVRAMMGKEKGRKLERGSARAKQERDDVTAAQLAGHVPLNWILFKVEREGAELVFECGRLWGNIYPNMSS